MHIKQAKHVAKYILAWPQLLVSHAIYDLTNNSHGWADIVKQTIAQLLW